MSKLTRKIAKEEVSRIIQSDDPDKDKQASNLLARFLTSISEGHYTSKLEARDVARILLALLGITLIVITLFGK